MLPFLRDEYPGITYDEAMEKFAAWCQSVNRDNLVKLIVSVSMTPQAWVVETAIAWAFPRGRTQRFLVDKNGVQRGGYDYLGVFPSEPDDHVKAILAEAEKQGLLKSRT